MQEQAPYDQAVADTILEDATTLAIATDTNDQGLSRLPMELQVSATFVEVAVNYLMMGVANTNLDEFIDQVSLLQA